MNDVFEIPESLKSDEALKRFKSEFLAYPKPENNILKPEDVFPPFTILKCNRFVFKFMDIPYYMVKNVEFLSENELAVDFFETAEFCVEQYFKKNFDVLEGRKIFLEYLDETGVVVRTDTYTVKKIGEMSKSTLDYKSEKALIIRVLFECNEHGISTCKE